MSLKDSFNATEWDRIVQAPMMAGFAVTAADPGGLVGAFQESAALAGAMRKARETAAPGSLVAEIIAAYETSEGRGAARDGVRALIKGRKPAEATEAAIVQLGETAGLVREKAPQDAAAFAAWLRQIAGAVAEAAKEGGFMGFGGEKVSDAERKTLADLGAVLGETGA
jgi:hypothetical protein